MLVTCGWRRLARRLTPGSLVCSFHFRVGAGTQRKDTDAGCAMGVQQASRALGGAGIWGGGMGWAPHRDPWIRYIKGL